MGDSTHDRDEAMNRLNGWQRLWVVACFVWGVFITITLADGFPTQSKVDSAYNNRIAGPKSTREYLSHPDPSRSKLDAMLHRGETTEGLTQEIDAAGEQYERDLKGLRSEQIKDIALAIALWFFGCVAVYGIALVAIWVYRGFRPIRTTCPDTKT